MFRFKMFGFSSNKSTEPTNGKSWILDFVLGKTLNPKGQTVKVCRHINGPQDDGSVVKQVSDCSVFINAVFTQNAIDNYNFDDESCTPPEWDQAILIVKDYHLKFVSAPNVTDCEFLLVIGKFSLLDVHDGFYSKNTARDCMVDPQVQVAVKEKWTQWMAETKSLESYNDESQYTGTCHLSQLLEEIGQPDTQNHSQTEASFHLSSSDDRTSRPAGPSKPLPARGQPSEAMASALAKMKQPTRVEDLIVSPEELAILEALEEWKEDYHPPPSQDTSSSSSSRPSFSQPTLAESPRKRDHTGACKNSGKTQDKNKLPQPGTSKLTTKPVHKTSQSTSRQDVSSDENRLTDSQIKAREASFSQSDKGNVDAECHQYSNKRADGQETSTSKEDIILSPNSSTNARPGCFSVKGISMYNESQQDKTPEGQGKSRTKDPPVKQVMQETNTVYRSPQTFTDEYLKFLDSSNKSKMADRSNSSNKSKMADRSNSSNKSKMADRSDSSDKSKMVDRSDSSNKYKMADRSDSSNKYKMADRSDSSDKSKMADENDICVIDVVTLCSLPTAWHKPCADSLEFSCSLPEDSQNSQDSQILMSSQGCQISDMSQTSETGAQADTELEAVDNNVSLISDHTANKPESNRSGKLSASSRMDLISEDCQSEIQARQTEFVVRGRSRQPGTRRVSFAPSAVMKCTSVDLDKIGSTQPFDVVNDSTYSMYEDAKSHLSNPDFPRQSSSHLEFPESQPFVPSSQDLLSSDSVEETRKSSSSDQSSRKDCTDDCDSVEHLTEAHSTGYSDSVINDTSFHHSTQTSGATRKSSPDFLISPIRRVTRNGRADKADDGDESGNDSVYGSALYLPESQHSSAAVECVVKEVDSQKRSAVDKAESQRSAVRQQSVDKGASRHSTVNGKPEDKAASLPKSPALDHPSFDESDSLERIPLSHGLCKDGVVETVQNLSTPETDAETSTTMVLTRSKRKKNFLDSGQKKSAHETSLDKNRRNPVTNSKGNMTDKTVQVPTLDKQNQSAKETDKDQSDIKSDSEIIIEEYSTDSDMSKQNAQDQSQKDSLKSGGDKSAPGGETVGADVSINMDVDSGQKAGPSCTEGNDSEDNSVILVSDEDEEHSEEIEEAAEPRSGKELTASKSGKRGSQKPSNKHPGSPGCHKIMEKYITTRRTRSSKQDDDADSLAPLKLRSSRLVSPGPEGDASSQAKISPKCTLNNLDKGTATHGPKKSVTDAGKKGKKRSKCQLHEIPETQGEEKQGPDHSQVQNKVIEEEDAEKNPSKRKKRREVEIMFEKAVEKYGLIGNVSKGWQAERCYGKPQESLSRANKKDEETWSQVLCEAEDGTRGAAQEELRGGAHKIHQSQVRESLPEGHKDMHADGGTGGEKKGVSGEGLPKLHQSQVRKTHPDKGKKHMHAVCETSQDHVEECDFLEIADQLDIENIPVHSQDTRDSKLRKRAPAEHGRRQMKGIMPAPYCRGPADPRLSGVSTWDVGRAACRRVSSIRRESGIGESEDVPKTQVLLDFLGIHTVLHIWICIVLYTHCIVIPRRLLARSGGYRIRLRPYVRIRIS
ncbi:dentin sialophosphoprotein-like isoform X2 [Haliotis rubra]|uniref:dentin sialophosphoprotein-like isoform X2 n=1 Tax=Haliotis rubra TaxID=36100 RepID=UPI001EE5799E|nr:dentin sialophosphoprotein-like isoform X2 [Haliotis rubra]